MAKLNIRNCVRCKKIFMPVGTEKICSDCRAEDLALEERVKAYVRDHPGITVNELIFYLTFPLVVQYWLWQQKNPSR